MLTLADKDSCLLLAKLAQVFVFGSAWSETLHTNGVVVEGNFRIIIKSYRGLFAQVSQKSWSFVFMFLILVLLSEADGGQWCQKNWRKLHFWALGFSPPPKFRCLYRARQYAIARINYLVTSFLFFLVECRTFLAESNFTRNRKIFSSPTKTDCPRVHIITVCIREDRIFFLQQWISRTNWTEASLRNKDSYKNQVYRLCYFITRSAFILDYYI